MALPILAAEPIGFPSSYLIQVNGARLAYHDWGGKSRTADLSRGLRLLQVADTSAANWSVGLSCYRSVARQVSNWVAAGALTVRSAVHVLRVGGCRAANDHFAGDIGFLGIPVARRLLLDTVHSLVFEILANHL